MTLPVARVTVSICTWNRASLLEKAIGSVLAQTLQEFELFVLDNASTDATPELMAGYAADPRITYVRRPDNIGHRANMTKAYQVGTAPYVTLLHDKEEMFPRNLERKVAFLASHPECVMVHGGFRICDEDGVELPPHRRGAPPSQDRIDTPFQFLRHTFHGYGGIQHISSVMARRSALDQNGFRDEDAPADDVALWLRTGARGPVGYLAEPLTLLRAAPGWSSSNAYLEIKDGRFFPTTFAAAGGKAVRSSFVSSCSLPPHQRLLLARAARRYTNRQLVSILRRRVPRLRPWREARPLLLECLRLEPTLLLSPRLVLLLKSYDAVERQMQTSASTP